VNKKRKNSSRNRRQFLKKLGAGVVTFALNPFSERSLQGAVSSRVTEVDIKKLRKEAAKRKRRIIYNNDGNDFNGATPAEPKTPENFLSKRTTPLLGSQVDSIFYCTGVTFYYKHQSLESEILKRQTYADELIEQGTDCLEVMTRFCRRYNLECFWSMRMNDNHDATRDWLLSQWKRNNPELLVGEKGDEFPYVSDKWSMVDYTKQQVRDKVYRDLKDVATRYDVDGLEYDFFRHPGFFKPQFFGELVTKEHRDMMTDLLRRVRKMADETGAKRGRPILIACRLPDSIEYCRAIGLDLKKWLEEDLVDIITGCGYFKLEPWLNWAALGAQYDVPAYACFVSRRIMSGGPAEAETDIRYWRGEALNAWHAGVDGIYTFNEFNPHDQKFREIGDPELLKTKQFINQTAYAGDEGYLNPGYWLKDGRNYIKKS